MFKRAFLDKIDLRVSETLLVRTNKVIAPDTCPQTPERETLSLRNDKARFSATTRLPESPSRNLPT